MENLEFECKQIVADSKCGHCYIPEGYGIVILLVVGFALQRELLAKQATFDRASFDLL